MDSVPNRLQCHQPNIGPQSYYNKQGFEKRHLHSWACSGNDKLMGCISTCLWSTCSELADGGETQGAKDVQYIEQPHEADHKRNDRKL